MLQTPHIPRCYLCCELRAQYSVLSIMTGSQLLFGLGVDQVTGSDSVFASHFMRSPNRSDSERHIKIKKDHL